MRTAGVGTAQAAWQRTGRFHLCCCCCCCQTQVRAKRFAKYEKTAALINVLGAFTDDARAEHKCVMCDRDFKTDAELGELSCCVSIRELAISGLNHCIRRCKEASSCYFCVSMIQGVGRQTTSQLCCLHHSTVNTVLPHPVSPTD